MKCKINFLIITIVILLGLTVFSPAMWKTTPKENVITNASSPIHNDTSHICLRNEFENIVLVVVFNFAHYSSIPDLIALYKNAFSTIMFCGPESATGKHTVEVLPIHEGYFGYICMSRAMQKHPGYSGYLLIADDAMLNYWNLVGLKRDQLWEGPKGEFVDFPVAPHPPGVWYWWNTPVGRGACQKALDEVKTWKELNTNMKKAIDILKENQNGEVHCINGHADVFYVPRRFVDAYTNLSDVFHKHRSFLEIAVPMIFRLIDLEKNFEFINGLYLARHPGKPVEGRAEYFWKVYNKKLAFLHPFKLNAKGFGSLNKILLRNWIIEYSDSLSKCEKN